MIETGFLLLVLFYGGVILFFYRGIVREKRRPCPAAATHPFVSVLIPARNEAANITATLESLARQTYPPERHEVLVIDDHSGDDTGGVVRRFIEARRLCHFRLLTHRNDGVQRTYKKSAISYAMAEARGEIILTTDADCRVQPGWIASMVSCFAAQTGLVAGLISFDRRHERTLFHKLQTLEFAGLVFAGVGAIGNHYPLICNGSNLAYRRAAFDEVGGFAGHEHIPSGDDDLFMQNLHRHTRWEVRYNLDAGAINYTRPVDTLRQFFHQRARWASKSRHYPDPKTFVLLLLIYLFYCLCLLSPLLWSDGKLSAGVWTAGIALKIIPEFAVIYQATGILRRRDLLAYFPIAELAQIPYIVCTGFAGFFKLFRWR